MAGSHSHHGDLNNKKLYWAVFINIVLTVFQIAGGVVSGSLSLLADALHNFSDAGALAIAAIAAKIAKFPPSKKMTYGYRRAEIIGALINSTTLVLIGLYLIYESFSRYQEQSPIDGWVVVIVAGMALVIDLATAFLTYSGSKDSINIRAAFIHNLSDAMASVVVIISGSLIIIYQVYLIDLIATALISAYVLYHAYIMIKECIQILMQMTPEGMSIESIINEISKLPGVEGAHHIHVWQLDDRKIYLEGHIKIGETNLTKIEEIKSRIRQCLKDGFAIEHSTLEIEIAEKCLNI
jgi:cobalt-zinc-cadmium efflux system protein|tara:strand:+ start:38291 stop:39175 length:885 start_codon:yes stop_codon:yes gene_type:complete